jgi:uncharacterized membrane protein
MSGEKQCGGETAARKPSALDDRVKWVLLIGVVASVALMILGLALYAAKPGSSDKAMAISELPAGILRLDPVAVISLGIIVLIATPVIRVVAVCITMGQGREYLFAAVAFIVLLTLIASFLLAGIK